MESILFFHKTCIGNHSKISKSCFVTNISTTEAFKSEKKLPGKMLHEEIMKTTPSFETFWVLNKGFSR